MPVTEFKFQMIESYRIIMYRGEGLVCGGASAAKREAHCPSNCWVRGKGVAWTLVWGGSQGPMPSLVFGHNVLGATQFLPQVGHL